MLDTWSRADVARVPDLVASERGALVAMRIDQRGGSLFVDADEPRRIARAGGLDVTGRLP